MAKINQAAFAQYKRYFAGLTTYIIGKDGAMQTLFHQLTGVEPVIVTNPLFVQANLPPPDILVFTGGSDVSPILYGEKNTASDNDINRDVNELLFYKLYEKDNSVLKVGICRGGQFLNVCNGGRMIQHLEGKKAHPAEHRVSPQMWVIDHVGNSIVNSTHHQGIVQAGHGISILTHNNITESCMYQSKQGNNSVSLCFQPHPEYEHEGTTSIFMVVLAETISYIHNRLGIKNVLPRVKKQELGFLDDLDAQAFAEEEEEV